MTVSFHSVYTLFSYLHTATYYCSIIRSAMVLAVGWNRINVFIECLFRYSLDVWVLFDYIAVVGCVVYEIYAANYS